MAKADINSINISGNLTQDPELRSTPAGTPVANLRLASNVRRKHGDEWVDKPNYVDVDVWGGQANSCAQYLRKGSRVFISGELDHQEWADKTTQQKRSTIRIRANQVSFEGPRTDQGTQPPAAQPSHPPLPVPRANQAQGTAPPPTAVDHDKIPF